MVMMNGVRLSRDQHHFEFHFSYAAIRTKPRLRYVLPGRTRRDVVLRHSIGFVILEATHYTFPFAHIVLFDKSLILGVPSLIITLHVVKVAHVHPISPHHGDGAVFLPPLQREGDWERGFTSHQKSCGMNGATAQALN